MNESVSLLFGQPTVTLISDLLLWATPLKSDHRPLMGVQNVLYPL